MGPKVLILHVGLTIAFLALYSVLLERDSLSQFQHQSLSISNFKINPDASRPDPPPDQKPTPGSQDQSDKGQPAQETNKTDSNTVLVDTGKKKDPPKTDDKPIETKPTTSGSGKEVTGDEFEPTLRTFPSEKNAATHCPRKDQRRKNLCGFFEKDCVRYGPVEELKYFWLICAMYTANQPSIELLYEHHKNFIEYAKLFGFQTQAIEVVFPGQEYRITKPNNEPYDLQFKAEWIFNMRENLVNVGAKYLPDDWQYIAWIDAHIFWDQNRYFFEDVVVELHRNNIVHMLESNDFYGTNNKTHFFEEGVAKLWQQSHSTNLNPIRQCGMAWATRKDIFEATHGSLDVCIGTKCDLYQNYAYFGEVYTGECSNPEYARAVREWQQRAIQVYDRKVGYVKGNIVHFEHCAGNCRTSSYDSMTAALSRYNFNPFTDMSRDEDGRMQFKENLGLANELWSIYGGDPRM